MLTKPLRNRLRRCNQISQIDVHRRPGIGALARHGQYWYPLRLILHKKNKWNVRWQWGGCQFDELSVEPNSITAVSQQDVVDSLWNDHTSRRKIRVSK